MKLSAVILTNNEEKNIARCIDNLRWCNEIIVIDDFSKDKTAKIARGRGAAVFKRKLSNNFAAQRNYALNKARGNWIMFVDADEIISSSLSREIVRRLKKVNKNTFGFYFSRKDFFINRWLNFGETSQVKLLRLARKNSGIWKGKVHETWQIKGNTEEMKNPILHYPHKNITGALEKINYYSSLRAQELCSQGIKTNVFEIVSYPLAKLFINIIWYQGHRDGMAGLVFALIMSFHSFLVRTKLWLLNQQKNN